MTRFLELAAFAALLVTLIGFPTPSRADDWIKNELGVPVFIRLPHSLLNITEERYLEPGAEVYLPKGLMPGQRTLYTYIMPGWIPYGPPVPVNLPFASVCLYVPSGRMEVRKPF